VFVGLDTNILAYAMDPAFGEHKRAALIFKRSSSEFIIAINPTVIHETYHTLVFKQKWPRQDAGHKLLSLIRQKNVVFLNQTKSISRNALYLANKYDLGGRDSLILSNYLLNKVSEMYTHDGNILKLKKIKIEDRELLLIDPLA
jgi:predicted nucleic acid-binding protein